LLAAPMPRISAENGVQADLVAGVGYSYNSPLALRPENG
jgi:hypothetical protein